MLKKTWLTFSIPFLWLGLAPDVSQGGVQPQPTHGLAPHSPALVAQQPPAWQFQAFGTEPFWGVRVSSRNIVYSTPDGTKAQFPYVSPLHAAGRPDELVLVFNLGNKNSLTLIQSQCRDGMSDQTHFYRAIFVFENRVYEGCANPS